MSKRISTIGIAVLITLTLMAGMATAAVLRARSVQASPLAGATHTCTPDLVVSANQRVVAHCPAGHGYIIPGGDTIYWFAYPTSDSANASRMLSVFETAKATGATLTFYFDTADLSGAAYGCLTGDCRAIWAVTTP
jgi:hypothetical protein